MGWHISCLENTLKVTKKAAKEILKVGVAECLYEFEDLREVIDKNHHLIFNSDHLEHMDFLWMPEIQKILKKNKAKGKVRFCDMSGDWAGTWWSYEFDGKGKMKKAKGKL